MAKVILMCGKICSGKSTYASALRVRLHAAVLSVDEIMLALFGQDVGEKHDQYVASCEKYLFEKSLELAEVGIDTIIDIGLWTKAEREAARQFYRGRGAPCEIHYLDISDAEWKRRIAKRNAAIVENQCSAYYVDKGLAQKFDWLFEKPEPCEVDVWIDAESQDCCGV